MAWAQKAMAFAFSKLQWIVGNDTMVRFWKDNWLREVLVKTYHFDPEVLDFLNDKVTSFISNSE